MSVKQRERADAVHGGDGRLAYEDGGEGAGERGEPVGERAVGPVEVGGEGGAGEEHTVGRERDAASVDAIRRGATGAARRR